MSGPYQPNAALSTGSSLAAVLDSLDGMMACVWLRYGAAGSGAGSDLVFGDRNGIVVIPERGEGGVGWQP